MVERYVPGIDRGSLEDAIRTVVSAAAAMTTCGVPVQYLGSVLVPEEELCFCRFAGPDAGAVEEANRRAGAPFWRVVEAVFIEREGVKI
jgi:Protein of unknown function (DUF4242)